MLFKCLFPLVASCSIGSAANILLNPSFESVTDGAIDNWIPLLDATSVPSTDYNGGSPYGARLLALNANSALPGNNITQDFSPLTVGETYVISFAYAQFGGNGGDQTLTLTLNVTSGPIPSEVFTDSTPTNDLSTGWERGSYTFVATGLESGITFTDVLSLGLGTSDLLIDDVSLDLIPEPTSTLLVGLTGLGMMVRRRR